MSLVTMISDRETYLESLKGRLVEEFRNPAPGEVEPLISIERKDLGTDHIVVIWRSWGDLTHCERSEVIIDAYEAAMGRDAALNVTYAMDMTDSEARRVSF
jgi:hypothetical protein